MPSEANLYSCNGVRGMQGESGDKLHETQVKKAIRVEDCWANKLYCTSICLVLYETTCSRDGAGGIKRQQSKEAQFTEATK